MLGAHRCRGALDRQSASATAAEHQAPRNCSSPAGLGGDHTALRAMTSPVFALENLICILVFSFPKGLECVRICEGLHFAECICEDDFKKLTHWFTFLVLFLI